MHFKWNYEAPTSDQKKAAEELAAKLVEIANTKMNEDEEE